MGMKPLCVMHTFQEDDLRANVQTGQWLDIQKAAAAAEGKNNPLFKGSLGMYRGVILHSHRNVIRFANAGAAGNVEAARALFMGSQAAVVAFGSPGTNMRFDWHEETRDNGDKVVITTSSIFGIKKVTFTHDGVGAQDFGHIQGSRIWKKKRNKKNPKRKKLKRSWNGQTQITI